MTFGPSHLQEKPAWTIENSPLTNEGSITYLGATLKDDMGSAHVEQRTAAAQRAFYSLQGAGLHFKGLDPLTASKLFSVGVRTVLTYGIESIFIGKTNMKKLESAQGKFVKAILGLRKFSRNTPLLDAMQIPSVAQSMGTAQLKLLRSAILYGSKASKFYSFLMCDDVLSANQRECNTLVNRCKSFLGDVNLVRVVTNDDYFKSFKMHFNEPDGIVDSIRLLFNDYTENARNVVQLLVNAF